MKNRLAKMFRVVWLSATACLLMWFLVLPLGARAGLDLSVQFLHGADDSDHSLTPRTGAVLTGSWNVAVRAASLSSLKNVSLAIQPDLSVNILPPLGSGAVKSESVPLGTQVKELSMQWDTPLLTPYNGVYQVVASADSLVERETATVANLKVNNPPATPKQVYARLEEGLPLVTWAPNAEPDIIGYKVSRFQETSLAYQTTVASPVFRDDQAPAGMPLRYEVAALRKSPVDAQGISSTNSSRTPTIALPLDQEDTQLTAAALPLAKTADITRSVEIEVKDKVETSRSVGFETLLPYEEIAEGPIETVPGPLEFEETLAAPLLQTRSLPAVDPLKHTAGAVMLLAAAMHLARLSRIVLRARA